MQSTGQASTQAVSLVPMQGSAIMYAIESDTPQALGSVMGLTILARTRLSAQTAPLSSRFPKSQSAQVSFNPPETQSPARHRPPLVRFHPPPPKALGLESSPARRATRPA